GSLAAGGMAITNVFFQMTSITGGVLICRTHLAYAVVIQASNEQNNTGREVPRMKFAKLWRSISIASGLWLSLISGSALADTGVKLPKLDLRDTRLDNGLRV